MMCFLGFGSPGDTRFHFWCLKLEIFGNTWARDTDYCSRMLWIFLNMEAWMNYLTRCSDHRVVDTSMDRTDINLVKHQLKHPTCYPRIIIRLHAAWVGGRRQEIKITLSYFNPGNPHTRSFAAHAFTHQSRQPGWGVLWCRVFRERTRLFESQWHCFFPTEEERQQARAASGGKGVGGFAVHDEDEPRTCSLNNSTQSSH